MEREREREREREKEIERERERENEEATRNLIHSCKLAENFWSKLNHGCAPTNQVSLAVDEKLIESWIDRLQTDRNFSCKALLGQRSHNKRWLGSTLLLKSTFECWSQGLQRGCKGGTSSLLSLDQFVRGQFDQLTIRRVACRPKEKKTQGTEEQKLFGNKAGKRQERRKDYCHGHSLKRKLSLEWSSFDEDQMKRMKWDEKDSRRFIFLLFK